MIYKLVKAMPRFRVLNTDLDLREIQLNNPSPRAVTYLRTKIRERIRKEVTPDNRPFAPLKPRTIALKQGPGILRESLALINSISGEVTVFRKRSLRMEITADVPYAATQHYGDPERNIPARPFMGLNREDERKVSNIFLDYLDRRLGRRIKRIK